MMRVAARVTCLIWALMLLLVCFTPTMGRPSSNPSGRSQNINQQGVFFTGGNPAHKPGPGAIIHKPSNRPPPPVRFGPRPRPRPRPWWQRG